jgi:hypothetical protein
MRAKNPEQSTGTKRDGDPGWIRTSDLQLRRLLLYPLSYGAAMREVVAQDEVQPPAETGRSCFAARAALPGAAFPDDANLA